MAHAKRVLGRIRTATADDLNVVPPTRWATRTWSRHPVPTRITGLTRAGPQAVRGGEAGHPGIEPGKSPGSEPGGSANSPNGHRYGRGELNSQTTRFERARYAGSRHARLVRRLGLEPSTRRLLSLAGIPTSRPLR